MQQKKFAPHLSSLTENISLILHPNQRIYAPHLCGKQILLHLHRTLYGLQDYRKLHYDIKKPFHHVPVSKQVIMQKKIYY